jgi:pimeloyl-ACP methyl ester carboxylesterase
VDFVTHHARYAVRQDKKGRFVFKCDPGLQSTELRSPEWLWEYLEQIICPTLVVHGEESDLLSPEVAQQMVDILPFGSLVEVDCAGHSIPGDNPEGFERAISPFLLKQGKAK